MYIYVCVCVCVCVCARARARAHTHTHTHTHTTQVSGDFADVFDGVGAQLGEFDVVTCFGKLN
jgi:hypothetical protein